MLKEHGVEPNHMYMIMPCSVPSRVDFLRITVFPREFVVLATPPNECIVVVK